MRHHLAAHQTMPLSPSLEHGRTTINACMEVASAAPAAAHDERVDPMIVDTVRRHLDSGDIRLVARLDEGTTDALRAGRNAMATANGSHPILGTFENRSSYDETVRGINRALATGAGEVFPYTEGVHLLPVTTAEAKDILCLDHLGRAHAVHNVSPINGSPVDARAATTAIENGRCHFDATQHDLLGHGLLVESKDLTCWLRTKPYAER